MHGSVKRIFEMSILTVFLGVTLYVILGMIWIKGASYVREHSPKHLPNFYMTLTVIRVTSNTNGDRTIFGICVKKL